MIKRLAYIVLLLIFASGLLSEVMAGNREVRQSNTRQFLAYAQLQKDTIKKHAQEEDQKKIKEISKAKRQAKPEKLGATEVVQDPKSQSKPRQRRPEGLDRPPEIPRRNGN
jgi:hypothetical protein